MDKLRNIPFKSLQIFGYNLTSYQTALVYVPLFLGGLNLLGKAFRFLGFVQRQAFRGNQDLLKKYGGNDSYAVVTGGSDGIGEAYCKNLAKQGFNICIIGRNENKIKAKLSEIQEQAGRPIKTKYVIADFAQLTKLEEYDQIAAQLKGIDIGILILNAGVLDMYNFKEAKPQTIQDLINVNVIHPLYLSKALINQLYARPKRSGVIFVSSGMIVYPFASVATYIATKKFSSYFAQALNLEVKDKIDVQAFECGMTGTPHMGGFYKNPGVVYDLPSVANGSLRDLGKEVVTYGCLRHDIGTTGFGASRFVASTMVANGPAQDFQKYAEEQAKKINLNK